MKTHFYRTMVISIIFVMSFSMQVSAESVNTYEGLVDDNVVENLNEDNIVLSKEVLNATLQEAQAIDSELETEELLSAIEAAQEVNAREDATQEEILTVEANLRQAIDNALAPENEANITKESLYTLYEEALIILEEMDDESASANLESALNSAINIYNQVDVGQNQINDAYGYLVQEMENAQTPTNGDEVEQEVEVIDELITIVTKGEYDRTEAMKMVDRIRSIHTNLYQELINHGIVIKLVNFPITELEEFAYLKGEVPRGWEGTGQTWDDVPGAGGQTSVARIGYSEMGNGHGSHNLELHEIAHPIDGIVLNDISESEEFLAIHAEEQANFLNNNYFEYPSEYFADAFAFYFLNDESRNLLKVRAPKTYEFIKNLGSPEDIAKDNLKETIRTANAINSELITAELSAALEHALAISNNPDATVEKIEEADVTLLVAIKNATQIPESAVNKNQLNEKINEADAIDDELKSTELINSLEHAITVSTNPDATQKEVNKALELLKAAIANITVPIAVGDPVEEEIEKTTNGANEKTKAEEIEEMDEVIVSSTQAGIGPGNILPNTATNIYNYLLIGMLFMLLGGITIVSRPLFVKE